MFQAVKAWATKRVVASTLLGLILFLWFVPVWSYRPHCGNYGNYADFRSIEGDMTPAFREAISIALWEQQIIHVRIGDRIYVPALSKLDPVGELSLGRGGVLDAELQAVLRLVDPTYSGTHVGKELRGRIYRPPGYLQIFLDDDLDVIDTDDCAFIRAVAFGERPPPGYAPEPSFLDRPQKASRERSKPEDEDRGAVDSRPVSSDRDQ